jgi:hypothetical protein
LKQPILKETMPNIMVKSKLYEITYKIAGNMKEGWMGIKGCHITDDMKTRNIFTSMVVSNSTLNLKAMG